MMKNISRTIILIGLYGALLLPISFSTSSVVTVTRSIAVVDINNDNDNDREDRNSREEERERRERLRGIYDDLEELIEQRRRERERERERDPDPVPVPDPTPEPPTPDPDPTPTPTPDPTPVAPVRPVRRETTRFVGSALRSIFGPSDVYTVDGLPRFANISLMILTIVLGGAGIVLLSGKADSYVEPLLTKKDHPTV